MAQIRLYADTIQGFLEYTGNTLGVNNFNTTIDITNHTQANPPPITAGSLLVLSNWRNFSSEATLTGLTGSSVVNAYLAWMSTPSPNAGGDSATNQNIAITFTTPLAIAFFQSQICDANSESATVGQLNTSGTFGNNNAPLGSSPGNDLRRWLYDITNVDISAGLTTSQSGGVFQFGPVNNGYMAYAIGLQIDAQAPVFNPTKTVDKVTADVGDTLIYTVTLAASGNTTANNVVFNDSLPSTVTYVPGTFAINSVPVAGGNPLSQNIGSLTVPAVYTITFSAVVNTVPNPNPIANTATTTFNFTVVPTIPNDRNRQGTSNTVNTNVNNASLGGITKSVDKLYADCGDTVTYTINIPNSGNVTATNVVFKDTIPNSTVLVANSVYVNGVQQVGVSPSVGVSIGSIAPGATASVIFSVVVQC